MNITERTNILKKRRYLCCLERKRIVFRYWGNILQAGNLRGRPLARGNFLSSNKRLQNKSCLLLPAIRRNNLKFFCINKFAAIFEIKSRGIDSDILLKKGAVLENQIDLYKNSALSKEESTSLLGYLSHSLF